MKKVVFNSEQLASLGREELLDQINNHEVSLLTSIGAKELLDEMDSVGFLSRTLVRFIALQKDDSKLRKRACKVIRLFAPAKLIKEYPHNDGAVVVGFNHPSLGEIFRLICLGFEAYPDKPFYFPINIPWYETLTPVIPILKRGGLYVTPMITPSTEKKLKAKFEGDEAKLKSIQSYKVAFERIYMKLAKECADNKGVLVVAPSATRQAKVFPTPEAERGEGHIHPTMTLLAHRVCPKEDNDAMFLPVTVFEPKFNDRKVNLFKMYHIEPCEPFSGKEVYQITKDKEKSFDFLFLKRINDVYKQKAKYE